MPGRRLAAMAGAMACVMATATPADAQTQKTARASLAPFQIPDNGMTTSTVNVTGVSGGIYHVTVALNITHDRPEDLQFILEGPGNNVSMTLQISEQSSVLSNTTLRLDDCTRRVFWSSGVTPGSYRPAVNLSQVNAQSPNGNWTLTARDFRTGVVGQINSWSLILYTEPLSAFAGRTDQVSCGKPDYDGDGRADVAVYRPPTGEWFISQSGSNRALMHVSWVRPRARAWPIQPCRPTTMATA